MLFNVARQAHVLGQELRMIPITWPFSVWGLTMVGPFKRSMDKKTHLLVDVDKFTKWVESELSVIAMQKQQSSL